MPVLDEAADIDAALAGARALSRARGVEVIVVDGGSRDGTAALAAPARRPRASRRRAGARCR